MVKLSDFLNSPWRLTTHRPRPCFIRNLILHLQWPYPDEQFFQLLFAEGMTLKLRKSSPLEAVQECVSDLLALLSSLVPEVK